MIRRQNQCIQDYPCCDSRAKAKQVPVHHSILPKQRPRRLRRRDARLRRESGWTRDVDAPFFWCHSEPFCLQAAPIIATEHDRAGGSVTGERTLGLNFAN